MIIRWTRERPFVYRSFMGYDHKTLEPTKQRYEYVGTYEKWRSEHPMHTYTDTLRPYQSLRLKQWQIEILSGIDTRARVSAKLNAKTE